MKKLFIKLVSLICVVIVVSLSVFYYGYFEIRGMNEHSYQKGFVYQYRALQKADTNTPKIVVIGGSYMTFSVDSKKLSEYTKMPVYTLGVHSSMGMCYVFETVERYINENDIIVFPFYNFEKNDYGTDLILLTTDDEPDMFWNFFFRHPLCSLKSAGSMANKKIMSNMFLQINSAMGKEIAKEDYSNSVYSAESFDRETGNLIYDRPKNIVEYVNKNIVYDINNVSKSGIDRINEFNKLCKNRNASFYITFPPCCTDCVISEKNDIIDFENDLQSTLNVPIISHVSDMFVPIEYLYDDNPHLNNQGTSFYTKQLYLDLKKNQVI